MKNLLLLDDSVSAIRFTEYYLANRYRLDGFTAVVDALAAAKKKRYDLIVADYFLPQGNGLDLVRALRALPEYAETPIILVTASLDARLVRQAVLAGVNDCLGKPYGKGEFLDLVERMLTAPYKRSVEAAPPPAPCVAWKAANGRHYQYCPTLNHLVEGTNAVEARAAMRAHLENRWLEGESWLSVSDLALVSHDISS